MIKRQGLHLHAKHASSVVGEVNKTVFFFLYKTYFKPKIHKTIASN